MTRLAAILVGLTALVGGAFLSVGAAAADAKPPCWRELIADWYDGRIDGVYSAQCYREAIRNAPEDLRGYSDLPSDLRRVLQSADQYRANGVTHVDAVGSRGRESDEQDRTSQAAGAAGPSGPQTPGSREAPGPVPEVLTNIGRRDADSIPLPLIALGALALLLIASGAAGLVARRLHARRVARVPDA